MLERKEKFKKECKLINLKHEYEGFIGEEQWAIVTKLTETELREKYSEELKPYEPFVKLSVEQGKVITDFHRNEDKFAKRRKRKEDYIGYVESLTECLHESAITEDFVEKQELEEYEEKRHIEKMKLLNQALSSLTEKQYKYLMAHFVDEKSAREIAREEGVSHQVVDRHIIAGVKKFETVFKDFF